MLLVGTTVLVTAAVTALPATRADAAPAPATDPPATVFPASKTAPKTPPVAAPGHDEASAAAVAKLTGKPVEVTDLTTETRQVFARPDGTFALTAHVRPVRVHRDGTWRPVDTTLVFTADGTVVPKATALDVTFSGGGTTPLATITDGGGKELGLRWDGALPRPTLEGNTATYPEVLPGVDLIVKADVDGFSELLAVKTPQAAANPRLSTLRFGLHTKGVTLTTDSTGALRATDAGGRLVFAGPPPRMWDSSGTPDEDGTPADARGPVAGRGFDARTGARQAAMATRVHDGTLEIIPDQKLLTGRDTKYPVYLDPWLNGGRTAYTWVYNRFPNQSYWGSTETARSGYHEDEGGGVARSLFRFDVSKLRGKQIVSATLQTWEVHSWSCSARYVELWQTGWFDSTTTWNKQPAWSSKVTAVNVAKGYSASCPDGGVDFNATTLIRTAATGNWTTVNMGLRAASETDTYGWKKFNNNPTLTVEYDSYPNVPTSLSTSPGTTCSDGKLGNTDVALRAVPSDPDGGTVTAEFSYWPSGGTATTRSVNVTSGNTASTTLLKSGLVDGATYYWKVRTYATGDYSAWSTTCNFRVDRTLPTADVDVTSTEYPAYEPNFTTSTVPAGTPGTFTISAKGNTDVVGFYVGIDDNAPTQYVAANAPGGSASIVLIPTRSRAGFVHVQTVDGVGNRSATLDTDYGFYATSPAGPHAHRGEFNADGTTDVVGRTTDGRIYLYLGDGTGAWLTTTGAKIDTNRVGYNLFRGGTWDDDGWNDLLAVDSGGNLVYHPGNGAGGYTTFATSVATDIDPGTPVTGWGIYNLVFSPGDFDGDTEPDIIARETNGDLYLFRGDGYGNLRDGGARTLLGTGWNVFNLIMGPGDINGDAKNDLIARLPTGEIYLYAGNGTGGVTSPTQFGTGWDLFTMLFSPGDWNGDGKVDLMGVLSDGDLHVYHGTHTHPFFTYQGLIGSGWTAFNRII